MYHQYDTSKMAFNPSIPVPKKTDPKSKPGVHIYTDRNFELYCENHLTSTIKSNDTLLDFQAACSKLM